MKNECLSKDFSVELKFFCILDNSFCEIEAEPHSKITYTIVVVNAVKLSSIYLSIHYSMFIQICHILKKKMKNTNRELLQNCVDKIYFFTFFISATLQQSQSNSILVYNIISYECNFVFFACLHGNVINVCV